MLILVTIAAALVLVSAIVYGVSRADPDRRVVRFSTRYGVEAAAQKFELPVKAVRRLRVVAGAELKTCGTCEHFNLSKGQEAISAHHVVSQVTRALQPATVSKDPMNTQSWSDFGACMARPGIVMGGTDWCGNAVHATRYTDGDKWS